MEYEIGYELCIYINAVLWTLCFIYRFICWLIKKIKREETTATIGSVCLWIILAIVSSIFGPVTLSIVIVFGGCWLISEGISFLWNHGLEDCCEWLNEHIFSKTL